MPDRTVPDVPEATIVDAIPREAPGSCTWVQDRWVSTTSFGYRWAPEGRVVLPGRGFVRWAQP